MILSWSLMRRGISGGRCQACFSHQALPPPPKPPCLLQSPLLGKTQTRPQLSLPGFRFHTVLAQKKPGRRREGAAPCGERVAASWRPRDAHPGGHHRTGRAGGQEASPQRCPPGSWSTVEVGGAWEGARGSTDSLLPASGLCQTQQSKLGIKTSVRSHQQAGQPRNSNVQETPRPPPGAPDFPVWVCRVGRQRSRSSSSTAQPALPLLGPGGEPPQQAQSGARTPAHRSHRSAGASQEALRRLGTPQASMAGAGWHWECPPDSPAPAPGEASMGAGQGCPPSGTGLGPMGLQHSFPGSRAQPPPASPALSLPGAGGRPGIGHSPGSEHLARNSRRQQAGLIP